MDKIILGIDLDGVIIDHALTKIRLAGEHGLELAPEDTSSERMREIMGEKAAEELGITHFVDDETRVLTALGHVEHRFLFGHGVTSSEGLISVASWEEFLNYIL